MQSIPRCSIAMMQSVLLQNLWRQGGSKSLGVTSFFGGNTLLDVQVRGLSDLVESQGRTIGFRKQPRSKIAHSIPVVTCLAVRTHHSPCPAWEQLNLIARWWRAAREELVVLSLYRHWRRARAMQDILEASRQWRINEATVVLAKRF